MEMLMINHFTQVPSEKGNGRFVYLCNLLKKNNPEINLEVITTSFLHRTKEQRVLSEEDLNKLNYKLTTIYEPGYKKNVSLKRFYSHYVMGRNLNKYLKNIKRKIDVIYCSVPSLDVAKVAAKYSKKHNIKFIIDVQDLWPEAFKMVFHIPILSNIIFYPMKRKANYIYKQADEIIAVSDTYANRAASVNNKYKNKLSVFLGTNLKDFDKYKSENLVKYIDDKIRIAYIGTLGHSYDLTSVIEGIAKLNSEGINNLEFVIMGDGPLRAKFENYAKEKDIDCIFTGRLEYPKMVGMLCSCDIAVNPISKGAAASIINKVGDYAAAGLPVINTQECEEYRDLVEKYNIGYNCNNNDYIDISKKIKYLIENKEERIKLGNNNRKLAEEKFDREKTYNKICELVKKSDI